MNKITLLYYRLYLTGQVTADGVASRINSGSLHSTKMSIRGSKTQERRDSHPGPIFLRRVTTGPSRYRMVVAFFTVFVAITIIVVLSVVYSNK